MCDLLNLIVRNCIIFYNIKESIIADLFRHEMSKQQAESKKYSNLTESHITITIITFVIISTSDSRDCNGIK